MAEDGADQATGRYLTGFHEHPGQCHIDGRIASTCTSPVDNNRAFAANHHVQRMQIEMEKVAPTTNRRIVKPIGGREFM